jgi:hypothetical protein
MAEDAGLATVVVDDDVFVLEGGLDKAGDDHSVLAGLTWADGVKEADCGDFKGMGLVKSVCNSFFKGFCIGICPADFLRGTDYAI